MVGGCAILREESSAPSSYLLRGANAPLPLPLKPEVNMVMPSFGHSGGLAFHPDGVLYFANHLHLGTIGRFVVGRSDEPETFIDLREWMTSYGERIPRAQGIRLDAEGRLVVAEAGTGKIIRISSESDKIEVLADSYDGTLLNSVWDVEIDRNGFVYASVPDSGVIYSIRPAGGIVDILNDELVRVHGLALSPEGDRLVAAEPDSGRVLVFDLEKGRLAAEMWTLVDFSPTGEEPVALAFDEFNRLFVGLGDAEKVQVFDLTRGSLIRTYEVGEPVSGLSYSDGTLFVSGGEAIQSISLR